MAKEKALTGAAGEYYVAFRLTAEGYAVGLTPRGTTSIDLIVANPETGKSVTIQTKTMSNAFVQSRKWGPYWKWRVGIRRPEPYDTFFYAFVDLRDDPSLTPNVFIVPSIELTKADLVGMWTDSSGRVIDAWCNITAGDASRYQDCWDIIKNALA